MRVSYTFPKAELVKAVLQFIVTGWQVCIFVLVF